MPPGAFEREVLGILAANRNPDSDVAGATLPNRDPASPRTCRDVDVFHDTLESLPDVGCLYLDAAGRPVGPHPTSPDFLHLRRHFGTAKGAWPRIGEG